LHAYFLYHPIARQYLAKKAKGAIMDGLNMRIIKEMPIPIVPVALQEKFVAKLMALNQLKKMEECSKGKCDALFNSLQHRAFRGEL
jgi:type I restriction enzyme S subunit